jgi:hypothetical protein
MSHCVCQKRAKQILFVSVMHGNPERQQAGAPVQEEAADGRESMC